jgi:hypothetical protein
VGDWPYQELVRPVVPEVRGREWVRNPLDAFVLARLEAAGLSHAPLASALTLVRRVYFDLVGLPPTPEQAEEFLSDTSPDAYERLIERLLASPHYGERWGRHWLDVARFAETNGYERDGPKANAWRYRDYVIRSFNEDKPYDRFILEQLAGDELEPVTNDTRIALGFNRLGPWDDEPADPLMYRYELLDDLVRATSNIFLGMTVNCARCHDHKFDPIPQADYYRLLAFFTPSKHADDLPLAPAEEQALFAAQTAAVEARVKDVQSELDRLTEPYKKRLVGEKRSKLPADVLAALDTEPARRSAEQKALVEQNGKALELKPQEIEQALSDPDRAKQQELDRTLKGLEATRPKPLPVAMGILDSGPTPPVTQLLRRGNARTPGEEVAPGFVSILDHKPPRIEPSRPDSTGRRLALARWIASPRNPMTARVMVNRVWQYHFGQGLIRTPNDFGQMGERPSHPELLDWLAAELVEQGWRLKPLHRLILTSNAYRMASAWNEPAGLSDPDNRLLWRFQFRRLDAEPIRDAILAASGRLNLEMGGPSIFPKIDPAILAGQSRPGQGWGQSDPGEAARRSVYIYVKRSVVVPLMEVLDVADSNDPCPRRNTSTVAPQALTLLNSEFMNEQADQFAARLIRECGPHIESQIDRAYRLALARAPRAEELQLGLEFLRDQRARAIAKNPPAVPPGAAAESDSHRAALKAFCLVLFNLNEFVYLD